MIGLDTNILVRLLVGDDATQAKAANAFLAEHCTASQPGFISSIVVAEIVWVLERKYKTPKKQIADAMEALLQRADLQIQHIAATRQALEYYRKGHGFADTLIGLINKEAGADYTLTFDKAAAKLPGFKLLNAA